mgnify:CR=1 FL=1
MALWEYKVITSGKGGFASATMLESYLNQLGKDEWEIIDFRTDPNNPLVFNGLARRPTQREWTLEAAVAAAAKAEADKIRAELMQKQHAGDVAASADSPAGSTAGEIAAGSDSLRQLRDTDRDGDPEALAEEAAQPDNSWDDLDAFEDDLPTFFDAIKPHLRKNQNAPGQSVALNYLAKRWEQPEADLHGALVECGFVIPENDTDAPVYLEFEGDLYWVEKNARGQYFLNTREKPRPKFRIAQGKPLDPSDPAYEALAEEQAALEAERAKRAAEQAAREAEAAARRAEREAQRQAAEQARREQQAAAQAAREAARAANAGDGETATADVPVTPGVLPEGPALLEAIRPQMRRNRRGPGHSGSSQYLAKYFKVDEATLKSALAALGLTPPASREEKAPQVVVGNHVYWVNKDNGGGLWINGREISARDRASAASGAEGAPAGEASAEVSAAQAEPGVFRPVPREMPPLPAVGPAEPESAPSPAAESAPVPASDSEAAPAPEIAPAASVESPVASASEQPVVATENASSESAASERPAVAESSAPGSAPEAVEAAAKTGAEATEGGTSEAAPVAKKSRTGTRKSATKTTKPRTKRRAASAIEADEAAEE